MFLSQSYLEVKPLGRLSRFMAQKTCIHERMILLGFRAIDDVIWGKYAPKTIQKGDVNRQFPSKSHKIFKLRYYQNCSTDLMQILRNYKDQQCHFAGGPAHAYKEPKMADGRHIGNGKLRNLSTDRDEIFHECRL